MDEKVRKYLEENTKTMHNSLLEELGIFEYEREYYKGTDKNGYTIRGMGYTQTETFDGTLYENCTTSLIRIAAA